MVRRQCPPLFNSPSDAFSILYLLSSNAAMPTAVVNLQIPSFPDKEIETTGVKKTSTYYPPGPPHISEYKICLPVAVFFRIATPVHVHIPPILDSDI